MRTDTTRLDESSELRRVNAELRELVDVDRRVLSRKQTIGYMFLDGSRSFHIDGHKDLFNDSILKISLKLQSRYNFFAGVWDIVDDFIVSALMEKTRTRWGKFVPYIFVGGLPYALIATLYWLLPLLFSPAHINDFSYLPKFFAYALIDMTIEFLGNIRSVSIEGYLSTITPYPSDRRRLLAVSSYFSIIYSRLPDIVVEFMLDFIKNGIVKSAKNRTTDQMIRRSIMIVGPTTAILAGLVFTWYTTIAKERVHQKIERPRIRDSLRVVMTNRPILIYMISNALGSFGTGLTTNDYYRQVLNWTTFETFAGIPSFFFQPIGFANYNRLARRFSTRTLFMVGQVFAKSFYIPLFCYGMFIKDRQGRHFFQNRWAMLPVTAVWEILYATMWGVRSISINEMRNECNDYLEWKYGYRSEATLSAASAFITKIPARINGILQPKYKQWVDYDQTAYTEGRQQPLRAQKWIFAMATLIPAIIVLTSMIPMFWFNIDRSTRDKMYRELNERRVAVAEMIKREADASGAAEEA
ncbi:MAG: MFS transporter [Clostridia bacterium]|nr:MFS transporter [Clostridia bacterium]